MKGKVERLKEFDIEFKGLKEGEHTFTYQINKDFFDNFENSLIEDGEIEANVLLDKQSTYLNFEFNVKGQVFTTCDRCLDPLTVSASNIGKLYVKFGEVYDEPSEEVIVLSREEYMINVGQYLYEYIVLGMPMQIVHSNKRKGDKCNEAMLSKLSEFSSGEHETEEIDPRWNELKKLIDKNK